MSRLGNLQVCFPKWEVSTVKPEKAVGESRGARRNRTSRSGRYRLYRSVPITVPDFFDLLDGRWTDGLCPSMPVQSTAVMAIKTAIKYLRIFPGPETRSSLCSSIQEFNVHPLCRLSTNAFPIHTNHRRRLFLPRDRTPEHRPL